MTREKTKMTQLLTDDATDGYEAPDGAMPPGLATSNTHSAWCIGRWLRLTGRSAPRDVRPSRGDTFHVNGMKVHLRWRKGSAVPEIERIA